MPLSLQERESLLARVEERLVGRNFPRQITRATVGRVCSAFGTSVERVAEPAGGGVNVVTLSTGSMLDLAWRVRRQRMATDISPTDTGCRRAGRHTMVVMRSPAEHQPAPRRATAIVGCNIHVGPGTARGGDEGE